MEASVKILMASHQALMGRQRSRGAWQTQCSGGSEDLGSLARHGSRRVEGSPSLGKHHHYGIHPHLNHGTNHARSDQTLSSVGWLTAREQ
ncbi:hypothetical protein MRB53_038373 [Persea americana]|nr:hypothetical protein MRB53_038373 [Persea americana]